MMEDYGLSQKEVAEKLGLSSAAISQYLSDKRGKGKMGIINEQILNQIKKSAKRIINGNDVIKEICRICEMLRSKGIESMEVDR
ncbi:MAG: helix-turn-helix domain-containing protein [Candidatus Thermoplasmatota archaeon]|nr:helix-turn-helix domain-containing protein [Candidatus Thermoplasmatota archaeon]